ncbi:DUF2092 domain-containing protein [Microbulbifer sp. ALW1]|uniref:DUF2092 domain-containing protein n=1 Tax=Microbulbifer sp. (strain ALW1) TaxID=1516059 RepID=UPI001359D022|nr:DUF2092 domain-containing protein [Microbulbifer sp. ALW1]
MKTLTLLFFCLALASFALWAQQDAEPDTSLHESPNTAINEAAAEARKIVRALEEHLSGKPRLTYETQLTSDVVLDNGQKIQIAGTTKVYFKRPNQLMVELETDSIRRQIYHDGKQLTVIAPNEKYYGTIEADSSSIEAMMSAANDYGLQVPLVDLIAWGAKGTEALTVDSATYIGETRVQGKAVDHWAFRGPRLDWEVWVTQGEDPLPLKISTVSYHDPSQPRFTAIIKWNERASIRDSLFTPKMDKDFRKIPFKKLQPANAADANTMEENNGRKEAGSE